MPVTCPKCGHVRQPQESAPDWQCPACGVAYLKAAEAMQSAGRPVDRYRPALDSEGKGIPWGKLILFFLFAAVVWVSLQAGRNRAGGESNIMADSGRNSAVADIRALASSVGPGDVVMYSTTECGYCTQAKNWLDHYGFAFTECNMSVESRYESEFRSYGAIGTPFLVVTRDGKEHHMKNGFHPGEFLALLAR